MSLSTGTVRLNKQGKTKEFLVFAPENHILFGHSSLKRLKRAAISHRVILTCTGEEDGHVSFVRSRRRKSQVL